MTRLLNSNRPVRKLLVIIEMEFKQHKRDFNVSEDTYLGEHLKRPN